MPPKKNKRRENFEFTEDIIEIIGEEKVKKIYELVGSQPVTFASINRFISHKSIKQDITGSAKSIKKIAEEQKLNRSTVYRLFKKDIFAKK